MNNSFYEISTGCDFTKVGNNSGMESECSPKLKFGTTATFEGLLINTPDEINWPQGANVDEMLIGPTGEVLEGDIRFPLAGTYNLSPEKHGIKGDISYQILVTAVDRKTAQSYSGKMRAMTTRTYGMNLPPMLNVFGKPIDETPNPGYVKGGYFNLDLLQNLGLPVKAAEYTVYASIGTLKSNVRVVKITIK